MKLALLVLVPTILIAYLGTWRVADAWYDRRHMHPAARGLLWAGLAQSAVGFGIAILWLEILAFHLGHIPGWGLRVYAPAVETVAILDVVALATVAANHLSIRHHRDQRILPEWDGADALSDGVEFVSDLVPSRGGNAAARIASLDSGPMPSGGGGGDWWPSFGLDLDLGEDGAILVVGIGVVLLAAAFVAMSLLGGGFVTYWILRAHARA